MKRAYRPLLPPLAAIIIGGCASAPAPQPGPAAAATDNAQAWRATRPEPGPAPALKAPVPVRRVLPNGLTVLAVPKHELPLVSLQVIVRSGSSADPAELPGLSGFLAEALKAGTKTRSAEAVADEIETRGAVLRVSADEDSIAIATEALTENFPAVFEVVAEVVRAPSLAVEEIERIRKRRLATLEEAKSDPGSAANRVFRRTVYGKHPYGHTVLGARDAVTKIGRKQLRAFFDKHFTPGNTAVIVVGDITAEAALAAVDGHFASWQAASREQEKLQQPPTGPQDGLPGVYLVERSDAPQSQLRIGHVGVSRGHPDYFPLLICNAILGGMFSSRINMNLREDKGYTYGARSYFSFLRGGGPFVVTTGVRTDVTHLAIREVVRELELIRNTDVTEDELHRVQNRYILSLPGHFQTVSGIGDMMASIYVHDLPLNYYQEVPDKVRAVTVGDVRRVAEQHIHPDALTIVVVGDRHRVEPSLAELQRGAVQLRDPEGNVL